jgi:hypothetical protein
MASPISLGNRPATLHLQLPPSPLSSSPAESTPSSTTESLRTMSEGSEGMAEFLQEMMTRKESGVVDLTRPIVRTHDSSEPMTSDSQSSYPITPISPKSISMPTFEESSWSGAPSPSSSVASTAKDGLTPRVEVSQPIWPLTMTKASPRMAPRRLAEANSEREETGLSRDSSLRRSLSWKRKHAR